MWWRWRRAAERPNYEFLGALDCEYDAGVTPAARAQIASEGAKERASAHGGVSSAPMSVDGVFMGNLRVLSETPRNKRNKGAGGEG